MTTAMINRSTSQNVDQCPTFTVVNNWWLFTTNDVFVILEIPNGGVLLTNIFDSYQWYDENTIVKKIAEYQESQL